MQNTIIISICLAIVAAQSQLAQELDFGSESEPKNSADVSQRFGGTNHKSKRTKGCGYRNVGGVGLRITYGGAEDSDYGEFPWMAAILEEAPGTDDELILIYKCGGSIIHPLAIITAAHCVNQATGSVLKIRAGEWDTQNENEIYEHQDRLVSEVLIHPDFSKSTLFNDVALLFLSESLEFSDVIRPICLPSATYDADFAGSECYVAGWGKDNFGQAGRYQVILQKIELPIVKHKDCQTDLRQHSRLGGVFILHETFICAGGEEGKDVCKGDGGSALVCPISGHNQRYTEVGIVSWGIGCGEKHIPGVYTNVPAMRGWVDAQMTQRNLTTSYYTA